MHSKSFPFVGKTYIFEYEGFVARDTFISDNDVSYEVISDPAKGITGSARFTTRQVSDTQYLNT